jgi:ubiquinone/menaquinone biosynthesis C-methylase UbiE
MSNDQVKLNDLVQAYWQAEPCGTSTDIVKDTERYSKAWFETVEDHRYTVEPYIHSVAQFTRHRGKRVLEVGVGAGTDHLQWARAGVILHGVDLTQAGIDTTRRRLELYGLSSDLRRIDAESLPFEDGYFDIVYSWGVIHHSERPEKIVAEIRRVLKPGGEFIGMFYQRPSLVTFKVWLKHGLFAGKPWRSFREVLFHHVESIGTKAYTIAEMRRMFGSFAQTTVTPILTVYDTRRIPAFIVKFLPESLGWFLAIRARRS